MIERRSWMASTRRSSARRRDAQSILLAALLFTLVACSSQPVRVPTYTVKSGDTLYSIATRYGLDYREVARWNRLGRDFAIKPGQVLRLYAPSGTSRALAKQPAPKRRATPVVFADPPPRWSWPVEGGVPSLTQRPNGGEGLTIVGRLGQTVASAADGRVVYTGSGLLGYGQLVIVKHNEAYLTAYGHLQSVVVQEGDRVRAGERIATMGNGPQGTPMLYFEIRVNGKPSDPLAYLPKQK